MEIIIIFQENIDIMGAGGSGHEAREVASKILAGIDINADTH
jgi:hypothetical protein